MEKNGERRDLGKKDSTENLDQQEIKKTLGKGRLNTHSGRQLNLAYCGNLKSEFERAMGKLKTGKHFTYLL